MKNKIGNSWLKCSVLGLLALIASVSSARADSAAPGFCIPVLMNCGNVSDNSSADQRISGSQWLNDHYGNRAGSRNYYLYVPSTYKSTKQIPLMIMLHGCFQSPADFARETGMNQVAEKYGFAVLYPEQTFQNNSWKCWNWFDPSNQSRGTGEASIIMGMVSDIEKYVHIKKGEVYAAGLSAGGALAADLAACYSDVIAGAGIHSGLEFKAATSESEAHQVVKTPPTRDLTKTAMDAAKCSGKGARPVAISVFHGSTDPYVNPENSSRVLQSFTKINDLIDDGKINGTQGDQPLHVRNDEANGYKFVEEIYGSSTNVMIQRVMIKGMGHAWVGAAASGMYADTKGPNASEMMWTFLSTHALKSR